MALQVTELTALSLGPGLRSSTHMVAHIPHSSMPGHLMPFVAFVGPWMHIHSHKYTHTCKCGSGGRGLGKKNS